MPNKLDRLLFAQGGHCFFCQGLLPKSEASVEHLVALANNGANSEDNCVACCKVVNALLGSLSLKEKLKAILLQPRPFQCPEGIPQKAVAPAAKQITPPATPKATAAPRMPPPTNAKNASAAADLRKAVEDNLRARKSGRPATLKTLTSTIKALAPSASDVQVAGVIAQLTQLGIVVQNGARVGYKL